MPPSTATTRFRVPLTRPQAVGETSAVLMSPARDAGRCVVVLGHGAGTDMANPILCATGRGLARLGHPVVTFNFAYVEAGRRAPDPRKRLEGCFADVLAAVRDRFGDRPLYIGGRSMGGRIASLLAADGQPCAGLVLLGYPLHAARAATITAAPQRLRTEHWDRIHVPALFVQGDRDRLCDLVLLERERQRFRPSVPVRVHVVRGGDHGFAVRRRDGRTGAEVEEEVVGTVATWLDDVLGERAA